MKKISQLATISVLLASFGVPILVSAAIDTSYLRSYKTAISTAVNDILIPVVFAVALLVFFFGIFKYFIYGATNESEKAEGRTFAMWGIIGFVIIVSVWGLVNIVKSTLIPSGASTTAPSPPTL